MSTVLLTTKLHIPTQRASHVAREQLVARMDDALHLGHRLILLSAPAGYGKTTLVVEWIERRHLPTAWLTLDAVDNDLARFLAYLVAALRTAQPDVGERTLALLNGSLSPSPEALLAPLVNDLAGTTRPLLLVLDDYHHIYSQSIHTAVTCLLDYLPAHVRPIIASRADPPLPVARLRGRGLVTELRLADLRFSDEEAGRFLDNSLGQTLPRSAVSILTTRTEGWVTGLQMAALSLAGQRDVDTFVRAFSGSNRLVLDYLIEEVLDRQTAQVQQFLLQTAILDRLCGPLCDAVIGTSGPGQSILEELDRANLFIVPLDDRRIWYRYHRLFADLLRQRLQRTDPELIPVLNDRASLWYAEAGLLDEAIEHALAAGDSRRAASLVAQAVEATMMRSEAATFLGWMQRLSTDALRQHPILGAYEAWAMLWQGAPLATVEQKLVQAAQAGVDPAALMPIQAVVALYQGNLNLGMALTRRALERLPEDALLLRSLAALLQATARMSAGDEVEGARFLEELAARSQAAGNRLMAAMALCHLAKLRMKQAELRQAESLYRTAQDLATDGQGRPLPAAGVAMIGLAELAREHNDLDTARDLAERGVDLLAAWSPLGAFDGYMTLLRICIASGDDRSADAALHKLRTIAVAFDVSLLDDYVVDLTEAQMQIGRGDLASAGLWAKQRGLDGGLETVLSAPAGDATVARLRKYEMAVLARLRLAEGRTDDALALLKRLQVLAEEAGRQTLWLQATILLAEALLAAGSQGEAIAQFLHAVRAARPAGFTRLFLDEGEAIRPLLVAASKAEEDEALAGYVQRLLAALTSIRGETPGSAGQADMPLIKPLSAREQEVLQLVAGGLTNQEIAHRLVISLRTVKFHTGNIFTKLGVSNRTQAVAQARELGMLD